MANLIGDRSFVASEMTPEMVVERVKRSCDVKDFDVTVETMKSGHVEEQDDLYDCVGIESHLSHEITQEHLVRKQEHSPHRNLV